jgi:adenosylhomocysteine nucleosidase
MNKQDILIVCALKKETAGQLKDWDVLYTGVGKVNATLKLTQKLQIDRSLPPSPKLVINYGTAGSRELPIGELVDCTKFTQRDMNVTSLGFMQGQTPFENNVSIVLDYDRVEFNPIGKKMRCGSGDNFVQDNKEIYSDVFDMEAYALAKVCHHYKIPFISFKYITDNANEHSPGDWKDNCSDGIDEFKEKVLSKIKERA